MFLMGIIFIFFTENISIRMKHIPFTKSQRHSDESSFVSFLYRYKTENTLYPFERSQKRNKMENDYNDEEEEEEEEEYFRTLKRKPK